MGSDEGILLQDVPAYIDKLKRELGRYKGCLALAERERDEAIARVERMEGVVEAAKAWRGCLPGEPIQNVLDALCELQQAVDALEESDGKGD